jgi:hypothetical protein
MLENILPRERILERFPDANEQIIGRNLRQLEAEQPDKMHAMALHQWDRITRWGPVHVDMFSIAPYADGERNGTVKFVSNKIGKPLIQDVVYQHFTVMRQAEEFTVAEFMLAQLYPNELHLADIEFSNPDRPLAEPLPQQGFEGLGLLKHTMPRIVDTGIELGCRAITLTAANARIRSIFERYGFTVSDTHAGRAAIAEGFEIGVPLELRL